MIPSSPRRGSNNNNNNNESIDFDEEFQKYLLDLSNNVLSMNRASSFFFDDENEQHHDHVVASAVANQTTSTKLTPKQSDNQRKSLVDDSASVPTPSSPTSATSCSSFIVVHKNNHLVKMMLLKQDVINRHIGTKAWKFYISSAIWNYTTTIINFSITLLTALSTGTVAGSNILSQQQTVIILFVTFILTITNSFFKLNVKMNLNFQAAKRYYQFGSYFEEIYYLPVQSMTDVATKSLKYDVLLKMIHKNMDNESIENQNYFTELIYLLLINNMIARGLKKGMSNLDGYSTWIRYKDRHGDLDGVVDMGAAAPIGRPGFGRRSMDAASASGNATANDMV